MVYGFLLFWLVLESRVDYNYGAKGTAGYTTGIIRKPTQYAMNSAHPDPTSFLLLPKMKKNLNTVKQTVGGLLYILGLYCREIGFATQANQ
jgi:hypothetical protein